MCERDSVGERERERKRVCKSVRGRERGERERVCVCAIERECDRQRVSESVCESASEGGLVRE